MKTKEELNALKEEVEALNKKLAELTEEEITQVSGGVLPVNYWPAFDPLGREPHGVEFYIPGDEDRR